MLCYTNNLLLPLPVILLLLLLLWNALNQQDISSQVFESYILVKPSSNYVATIGKKRHRNINAHNIPLSRILVPVYSKFIDGTAQYVILQYMWGYQLHYKNPVTQLFYSNEIILQPLAYTYLLYIFIQTKGDTVRKSRSCELRKLNTKVCKNCGQLVV